MAAPAPFDKALALIDAAHALDPSQSALPDGSTIHSELHYAQRMTHYLSLRCSSASEPLRLAVRAQHLRRWEVPRSSYPQTRAGYYAWRTFLGKRQAEIAESLCREAGMGEEDVQRVGALVRKEGLRNAEEDGDVQVLEDVACLVFLEERLEGFVDEVGEEEKLVGILRKTWGKMSELGRELALRMELGGRAGELVKKAVSGQ